MTLKARNLAFVLLGTAALLAGRTAVAQGFAAVVSPPRFEMSAKAGERVREVVEISNAAAQDATYYLRTADWQLDASGGAAFSDELAPGSCRPWVAIERREIAVPAGGRYRYRFEVQPPAGTPDGECRFALMIEGDEQTVRTAGGLNLPLSARIAVIVYVRIGDAAPNLGISGTQVSEINGAWQPVIQVSNSGNAHGRLAGFLSGTDAKARKLEFAPSTLPILPGETRAIVLAASDGANEVTDIAYPITIKGVLELGSGQRVDFEQRFAR